MRTKKAPSCRPSPALVLALGALLLPSVGCGDRAGSREGAPRRTVPAVEAVRARVGALPLTQRLSGVVEARNQVEIYPEISAVVREVLVQDGDPVERGAPLVRLRDTEYRKRLQQARANHRIAVAQLRGAEAGAKEARAELGRYRSLAEQGLASSSELDAAEARAEAAAAEVQLAEARVEQALGAIEEEEENLSQTVLRAPVTGTVGDRDAEVGMLATPGGRLFSLGQLDSVRVQVILTDRMLAYIEVGQRAQVSVGDATLSAPVARISPFLHPVAHSTEAEIDLANPDRALKPGMFVTVDVFYGESETATLVPLSALYENPVTGAVGVYVTEASLELGSTPEVAVPGDLPLSDPVAFDFVPVPVIAEGRMAAAVGGVDPGRWVITLGQNLLGGEAGEARVRRVPWDRVEALQRLQREDLMEEVVERQAGERTR